MKRAKATLVLTPTLVRIINTPCYAVPDWAFVRVARGVWWRVHQCVAFVSCPSCSAPIGEPCTGKYGPRMETHFVRRKEYTRQRKP